MDSHELLMTAARTLGVYLFMLIVIRLLGKREVGTFSAFDLLVALMLGEVVDEVIYGDVVPVQGIVAVVVIALAQYATGWLAYANRFFDKVLEGVPTVIVQDGELQQVGMRKERVNEQEVMALLRQQSIDDVREVKLAVLEVGGQLTVIKQDWAEPVQKGDLQGPESEQKQADTGGQEQPPLDKQTDSARALGHEQKVAA